MDSVIQKVANDTLRDIKTQLDIVKYLLKRIESDASFANELDCKYNFIVDKVKEIRKEIDGLIIEVNEVLYP